MFETNSQWSRDFVAHPIVDSSLSLPVDSNAGALCTRIYFGTIMTVCVTIFPLRTTKVSEPRTSPGLPAF